MPVVLCRSVRLPRENHGISVPMDVGGRLGVEWAGDGKRGAGGDPNWGRAVTGERAGPRRGLKRQPTRLCLVAAGRSRQELRQNDHHTGCRHYSAASCRKTMAGSGDAGRKGYVESSM
jgi:hypothetical protein